MLWAVTQGLEGCRHVWTNVVTSHHHLCAERLHANNQVTWLQIHLNITSLHSIKPRVKTGGPVSELMSYVKEEVDILSSTSLIDCMASVDVKQHWIEWRHKLNSINVIGKQGLYKSDINCPQGETTVKMPSWRQSTPLLRPLFSPHQGAFCIIPVHVCQQREHQMMRS